jgi:hypothetical protein
VAKKASNFDTMLVPVGVPGYHCSSGTLVDGELPRNRGHRGVHILWGGLPCVPPPSKDGESPSNPNVPWGGGVEMELGVWTLALCARMYPGTGQHQNQCAHWVTPLLKNYTPFWIIYGFNDFPPH